MLVAVVVIVILAMLGPTIGNVFSNVLTPLRGKTSASSASAQFTFNCSASGTVDVKLSNGATAAPTFTCTANQPYTYDLATSGRPSGTQLIFKDTYPPYTTLASTTVP